MKRFFAATHGWRVGAVASVLLAAVALAGPAAAKNMNLTATAQYSSSSDWQSDQGNTTFVAAKAFDGDLTTRWNSFAGMAQGEWLAAKWAAPVTFNKVVLREAFDRIDGMRVQQFDTSTNDWADIPAGIVEDATWAGLKKLDAASNATVTVRFATPITTTGVRTLFTQVSSTSLSVFEVEAWNNPQGTVTGTVKDASGNPIAGAKVTAGGDSTTTNASGTYTLTTDAGTYNVIAVKTAAFRRRVARGIALTANATVPHDFVLTPEPTNLAPNATAVSSSDYQGGTAYNAAKANDGKLDTRWNSDAGDTDGSSLELQWAQPQTFNRVTIREAIDRIRNYTLQRYDDASASYVDLVTADIPKQGGDPTVVQLFAAPVTTKRLKLLINTASDLPSVWELEAANAPVGAVTGVVNDVTTNKPVANATITDELGNVLATADANGQFTFVAEPDDYFINATATNYFPGAAASFTLNAGDKQPVTLTVPAQGPDIAKTATASASTEDSSWPAVNVNDGDPDTYWLATDVTNQWVAVTWPKATHFTAVQLQGFKGTIESSHLEALGGTDGKTWVPLDGYDGKTGAFLAGTLFNPEIYANAGNSNPFFFFPDGVTTTSLRFFITATNSTTNIPGLSEMQVFDSPIPKPAP